MGKNKKPIILTNHIEKSIHAYIPERLYQAMIETAIDWAIGGDIEIGAWIYRELLVQKRDAIRREYYSMLHGGKFKKYRGLPCEICGNPADTIDHIIPLSRLGTNDPENLRPLCRKCNSRKNDHIDQ